MKKAKIVNLLNNLLGRVGFVLVGKQWLKSNTFKIVDLRTGGGNISPIEALSFFSVQDLMYVLNIPLDKVITSKPMKAWIETARLIDKEDLSTPIRGRASFLFLQDFYQSFQPKNVAERLGLVLENSKGKNREYLKSHPLKTVMPWESINPEDRYKLNINVFTKECKEYGQLEYKSKDGYNAFGPISLRILEMEYNRLVSVYKSIKDQGYNEKYGYLKAGSVFVKDNDYKLSIVGGRHRAAVMFSLKYEYIPVTISKDKSVKLISNEVDTWNHVKSGLLTKAQAEELFDKQIVIE